MNNLFSTTPLLSVSERNINMDIYFFNRFITKYPYRKPLPKKRKLKKIDNERKKKNNKIENSILTKAGGMKEVNFNILPNKEFLKNMQNYENKINFLKKSYNLNKRWKL